MQKMLHQSKIVKIHKEVRILHTFGFEHGPVANEALIAWKHGECSDLDVFLDECMLLVDFLNFFFYKLNHDLQK